MKLLFWLTLCVGFLVGPAWSQDRAANSQAIVSALNTPDNQWIFNHICIPAGPLRGRGFNNAEFVDAYISVSETRWVAALSALSRGDQDASMKSLAPILHGVVDSYWPNRVKRNEHGEILAFRECEDLGNLPGVLREERSAAGPQGETKDRTTKLMSEVIRKWKDKRPFDEVAAILLSGPMKLAPQSAALPVVMQ